MLLVLDLDGTLVDTIEDLRTSANRLLTARGLVPLEPAEIRPMIGDGIAALVARALASRGHPVDEDDVQAFHDDYSSHPAGASCLFAGVTRLLDTARDGGWRLAVCTNKPVSAAERLLAALGIDTMFAAIGGGDSFAARKPDPAHLLGTIAEAGGEPKQSVMVGDHRNDILAARGAGVASIFAGWGYGTPDMADGAGAVAASPDAVLPLARGLLAAG